MSEGGGSGHLCLRGGGAQVTQVTYDEGGLRSLMSEGEGLRSLMSEGGAQVTYV